MANEWKKFDELFDSSTKEIFRLQLLNVYNVKSEENDFRSFTEGKQIHISPQFQKWLDDVKRKKEQGVRNINMQVVELPLTDYLKFEISSYPMQESLGRETFIIDRKSAGPMVLEFQDHWMFDEKNILLMNYDAEGHFKSAQIPTLDAIELAGYVKLKDELLRIARPMREFFTLNNIEFPASLFV